MLSDHLKSRQVVCLLAVAILWLSSAVATAQTGGLDANLDSFEPLPVQREGALLSVATSRTLDHLEVTGGVFVYDAFGLAQVARVDQDGNVDERRSVLDYQLTTEVGASVGLFGVADVGVAVPVLFQQRGPGAPEQAGEAKIAMADVRVYPRVALIGAERRAGFGMAVLLPTRLPLGSARSLVSGGQFSATPTLAVDWTDISGWQVALNAGYTWRQNQPDALRGDTVEWGVGGRFPLASTGLHLVASMSGQVAVDDLRFSGSDVDKVVGNPVEFVGAIEWRSASGLVASLGSGRGLNEGIGSSGLRLLASAGWSPGAGVLAGDADDDGVSGEADQCPQLAEDRDGYQDSDGCPDTDNDGDGLADAQDACPDEAEDKDGFEDNDGCPEVDNDGDGLADADDTCPNQAEDLDGFEDENGCPDRDNDGDGLVDAEDKCPSKAETPNGFRDADGCPDEKPTYVFERKKPVIVHSIHFKAGSDEILEKSYPVLDEVARSLRQQDDVRVRVEGHTDDLGDAGKNLTLSQQRALAVVNYLIDEGGIDRGRLDYEGYGETRPLVPNEDKESRAKNRRVEFRVIGFVE